MGKCQCLATIKAVCKKEKDGLGQTPCSIKLYMGFFHYFAKKNSFFNTNTFKKSVFNQKNKVKMRITK